MNQNLKVVNREDEKEVLLTCVIGLSLFASFENLYLVLGNRIKDYEKDILKRVYSEDKVKKFEILVIHFRLLD